MSPPHSHASSSQLEVGSTMKLANVPVWFFLRRQDVKVRRFMIVVMGVALLLGCWQLSTYKTVVSTTTTTTPRTNYADQVELEAIETKIPIQTTTTTNENIDNNNNDGNDNERDTTKRKDDAESVTLKRNRTKSSNRTKTKQTKRPKGLPMSSIINYNESSYVKFTLSDEEEFQPKIAWLTSWPNSGTSFTLSGVEKLSNKSIATNYGDEVTSDKAYSLSIYPLRIEGPFWKGTAFDDKLGGGRDLPNQFVLTKTHCGGRCSSCGPDEYVESTRSFLKACASGHGRFPPRRQRHLVHYPPSRIHRAVQLIRNPFHNVVARFHLDRRNKDKKQSKYSKWVEAHPENAQGFMTWCQTMNADYEQQEVEFFNSTPSVWEVLRPIPCRAEFYMYIQWHNLLHESLDFLRQDTNREIPLLTVHYEDYRKDLQGTFSKILKFLELEEFGTFPEFTPRDDTYHDYFTEEQRTNVKAFLKHVASNTTWNQLRQYF